MSLAYNSDGAQPISLDDEITQLNVVKTFSLGYGKMCALIHCQRYSFMQTATYPVFSGLIGLITPQIYKNIKH